VKTVSGKVVRHYIDPTIRAKMIGGGEFDIVVIRIFDLFCSCDLDLNPITFIYELDRIPGDIPDV